VHAAFVIAGKDLRQRFRDRSAVVLGFLAPLAIAAVMSAAFSGADNLHIEVALVDRDGAQFASGFRSMFDDPQLAELVTLREVADEEEARQLVDDDAVSAAVVLPSGFSASVTSESPKSIEVLTSTNSSLGGQVIAAIAGSYMAQVNATRLSVASAAAAGAQGTSQPDVGAAIADLRLPIEVVDRGIGAREMKTISYYGPSMGIFFALFAVSFGARSFFGERTNGTLDRLSAAPIGPGQVLLGKAIAVFAYGLASLGTVVVVTSVVFGANWGSPVAVAALCIAMTLAVVALTALVTAVARTDRQADGIASASVFILALLGGNFIVSSEMPETLRKIALATPNGWALRGFSDLAVGIDPVEAVFFPVIAMLVFAVAVSAVAAVSFRRLAAR
jgi:ABC-2 type transport system permease protein